MMRMINFVLIGLMLVGAGVVYDFKYEAGKAAATVARINHRIEAERDAIATLKAEWSLLNQPKRLQELAERHHAFLELDPLDPTQIGSIDDIPFRPAPAPVAASQPSEPVPPVPGVAARPSLGVAAVPGARFSIGMGNGAQPLILTPSPVTKASVKLAQPEKSVERTGSIGKFLDRLPQAGGRPEPTVTGSIPKSAQAAAPMMLAPPGLPTARPVPPLVPRQSEPTKVTR